MAEEYLYGVTLSGSKASEVWDHEPKMTNPTAINTSMSSRSSLLKWQLLGPEAKPGETNVLQVEAMGLKGPIKIPIAVLEMGKTSQVILDLSFPDPPVTFTLIKGTGPLHIIGHNLLATHIEEFENMEDDEIEVDNLDDEDDEKEPQKKRKLSSEIKKNGTKRAKMDEGDPEDEDEEDDEPKKKKNKVGGAPKNKNQVNKNQNQNQNQKKNKSWH